MCWIMAAEDQLSGCALHLQPAFQKRPRINQDSHAKQDLMQSFTPVLFFLKDGALENRRELGEGLLAHLKQPSHNLQELDCCLLSPVGREAVGEGYF